MLFITDPFIYSLKGLLPGMSNFSTSWAKVMSSSVTVTTSLQCRRIFGAGALNNPSLLSPWARKGERAGASQK